MPSRTIVDDGLLVSTTSPISPRARASVNVGSSRHITPPLAVEKRPGGGSFSRKPNPSKRGGVRFAFLCSTTLTTTGRGSQMTPPNTPPPTDRNHVVASASNQSQPKNDPPETPTSSTKKKEAPRRSNSEAIRTTASSAKRRGAVPRTKSSSAADKINLTSKSTLEAKGLSSSSSQASTDSSFKAASAHARLAVGGGKPSKNKSPRITSNKGSPSPNDQKKSTSSPSPMKKSPPSTPAVQDSPPDYLDAAEAKALAKLSTEKRAAAATTNGSSPKPQVMAVANNDAKLKDHIQQEQRELDDFARQKAGAATGVTSRAAMEPSPGAYMVQGRSVERVHSGCLSPHIQTGQKKHDLSSSQTRASKTGYKTEGPVVVAAELVSDAEAQIEEQVRQKILQEAPRADLVAVEHSTRSADPNAEARRIAAFKEMYKPKGVIEKVFGDSRSVVVDIAANPETIRKREFLQWSLKRNRTTNMWVATVNTNQKALDNNETWEIEKAVKSYPATSQEQAYETGLAHATPRMLPFEDNPICHICKSKFALLRRPSHCRNCGVCVCSNCSTSWPAMMVPDTYNIKNESSVNVCLACDWLSNAFREALIAGRYKSVLYLYETGNLNVRMPFCNPSKKEEVL